MLADPTLQAVLAKLSGPVTTRPSVWAKIKASLARLKAGVVRIVAPVVTPAVVQVRAVTRTARQVGQALGITWRLKKTLAIAAGIGLAVTGVSYLSTHGVAAVLSGIGGAVTAVVVQAGLWVRRSATRLRFV